LTNHDHVFAILSPLGTPTVKSAMTQAMSKCPVPVSDERGRGSFLPLEPFEIRADSIPRMEIQKDCRRFLNARRTLKVGLIASDDAFGRTVRTMVWTMNIPRHGRD